MFINPNVVKSSVYGAFASVYTLDMGNKAKEVSTSDRILAEYLRNAAIEQGFSVRAMSEKTGVSVGRVSELLRGMRSFYYDEITRFCQVLNLPVWDVLKAVEDIERKQSIPYTLAAKRTGRERPDSMDDQ